MSDFLTNKSKIIKSDLIVHILSFCYKHYNDNHLFNDIMHVINSEFCYNLYLSSNIDAAIINNLREVIEYDRLKTILLESFNLYCEYNRELKPFTISEVFDFQFFSMDDLKKTIIMNEIIYHYNLENELIEIISSTKDINPNIASSILFLINNYEVFSLKYLNVVRKDETYKIEQGKYTIIWFNILVDTKHIENLLESSDDIEKNEDEYIKYRLLNNIFYDPDFLEHLIHYVGLYSKEVCDEFDKIISSRKSEDEVFFSNSSIMIKILELMLASQNLYHDYSRVLIKYVIDNKNDFLNNIYNHFITDEVVLLKYLKLCLKLCLKHNLKSEMSLIIESFKTIFFVNDSELIDIILKSKDLLLTQNLEQLQYIHFLMKSYIEMNLNINKLVDFDEISFRELLLKKISENQSMATRVIEYYLPLHENDEYCKKILGELNTYFFTSTKGLEEKSLINLLIISIHLINRLLEESYCGMILKEDNFTEKHFSLDNNEIYKYQELYKKIDEMSQLEHERYQADEDYLEWSDIYCDMHYDSLIELKKEISVNQIISIIRAKKCHDYLYELDDQILNIRSKPLNIKSIITVERKRRLYKVLKEIRIVELEKSIQKAYVDDFQLKRIEQLGGCFEYLSSAEDYWNTTLVRDSNRVDYTPYVANYIKLIEILLIEIIKKYIERKKSIGQNVIFKASNGSLINLTNEKEIHFVTLGDILHFIKRHDDIIILDNKSIVLDYLYYFKDKIRNSKFHTSIISNFQEAYEIRYNALSILKRILYDIY